MFVLMLNFWPNSFALAICLGTAPSLQSFEQMQMASQILSSGIGKSQQAMAGEKGAKVVQLSNVTKYVHDKNLRIMSDFSEKQPNADDWLKIVNEDKTGPMLLEDHFARVKVCGKRVT